MKDTWYLGAQNDTIFIIKGRRPAMSNDYPDHDADRTVIAGPIEEKLGLTIVKAHNDALCDVYAEGVTSTNSPRKR